MLSFFQNLVKKFKRKTETKKNTLTPEAQFILRVENGIVINERPEKKTEKVALADLKAIIIETNNTGPWGSDIWWILIGSSTNGCVFPCGATGEAELLKTVQKLPKFDNHTFIEAMASTENKKFLCWKADEY